MRDRFWLRDSRAYKSLVGVKAKLDNTATDHNLLLLVYLLTSHINGCGFCIDMHEKEIRDAGIPAPKANELVNWQQSSEFSSAEKAAFAWTRDMTHLGDGQPSDAAYADMEKHYTADDITNISIAVSVMNALNRMAISFHREPGL